MSPQTLEWNRRIHDAPLTVGRGNPVNKESMTPERRAAYERQIKQLETDLLNTKAKALELRIAQLERQKEPLEEPGTRVHVVGTAVYGEHALELPTPHPEEIPSMVVTKAGQVYREDS